MISSIPHSDPINAGCASAASIGSGHIGLRCFCGSQGSLRVSRSLGGEPSMTQISRLSVFVHVSVLQSGCGADAMLAADHDHVAYPFPCRNFIPYYLHAMFAPLMSIILDTFFDFENMVISAICARCIDNHVLWASRTTRGLEIEKIYIKKGG